MLVCMCERVRERERERIDECGGGREGTMMNVLHILPFCKVFFFVGKMQPLSLIDSFKKLLYFGLEYA